MASINHMKNLKFLNGTGNIDPQMIVTPNTDIIIPICITVCGFLAIAWTDYYAFPGSPFS